MDFRLVLPALAASLASPSAMDEFDVAHACSWTATFVLITRPEEFARPGYASPTVKTMSDYLDRLFKMGFLRRRRVTRVVTTSRGKRCNRGFKYVYKFSRQGLQYLEHMGNPRQAPAPYGQTWNDKLMIEYLRRKLSDTQKQDAARIYFAMFRGYNGGGRYTRFPLKEHLFWLRL